MNPRNQATMVVRNGPLLGPVLTRVIGMLAARAQCPIDRLEIQEGPDGVGTQLEMVFALKRTAPCSKP